MIFEEKKRQIKEEEIYRREFKASLEKQEKSKSRAQKLWFFLNSAVFLWFLSSVVIGAATFFYTKHTENIRMIEKTKITLQKLDAEISGRLHYLACHLDPKNNDPKEMLEVFLCVEKPTLEKYPISVFPEYEKRNLRSLLWELHSVVCDNEKPQISTALQAAFEFQEFYRTSKNEPDIKLKIRNLIGISWGSQKTRKLFGPLDLQRWEQPFTKQWNKTEFLEFR